MIYDTYINKRIHFLVPRQQLKWVRINFYIFFPITVMPYNSTSASRIQSKHGLNNFYLSKFRLVSTFFFFKLHKFARVTEVRDIV